jgi:hypothetical protein
VTRALAALCTLLAVPAITSAQISARARLRPPSHGFQVRLSPIEVPAGQELEVCQLVELPNGKAMDVNRLTIAMPSGLTYASHHFAVFYFEGDDPEKYRGDPFERVGCSGVGGQTVSPILAFVQRPKQRIRFPRRVGLRLGPHQVLLLNSHWVNGGTEAVTVDVAANLYAARRGSVRHHARSFQLGSFRIDVPAGQPGSATARWVTPFPMNVVWLSTHSHKHTTSVVVDVLRGGAVAVPEELTTLAYAEPTVNRYPRPLRLEAGDGFHWTCNYLNSTDRRLTFGVTAEDEMCFTVGFFYLDDDAAPLPPVPGCFGRSDGLVCPGN